MKQLSILITLLLMVACDDKVKDKFPSTYPCCYQSSIDNILSMPPDTPRSQLYKLYYDNQYVYVFSVPSQSADFLSVISDERCEDVCYSGGIVGFMCDDWEDAEFIEVAWKDPR